MKSDNNVGSNKPLSEMTDAELGELGYKRHGDGSIRDSAGHFAGNSGTILGTPGVDMAEEYLSKQEYTVKEREISVKSSENKLRRYDIVMEDAEGNALGIEVKSGSATRTRQQTKIDRIVDVKVIHVDASGNITIE